jgi:hypothetical protein
MEPCGVLCLLSCRLVVRPVAAKHEETGAVKSFELDGRKKAVYQKKKVASR